MLRGVLLPGVFVVFVVFVVLAGCTVVDRGSASLRNWWMGQSMSVAERSQWGQARWAAVAFRQCSPPADAEGAWRLDCVRIQVGDGMKKHDWPRHVVDVVQAEMAALDQPLANRELSPEAARERLRIVLVAKSAELSSLRETVAYAASPWADIEAHCRAYMTAQPAVARCVNELARTRYLKDGWPRSALGTVEAKRVEIANRLEAGAIRPEQAELEMSEYIHARAMELRAVGDRIHTGSSARIPPGDIQPPAF